MKNANLQEVTLEIEQTDVSDMDEKYLTFWTDKQLFGIQIVYVMQIVGMQSVTEVPEFPNYAKGIINLRGSIIPLIDMRLRLGKQEMEYNERTCIIVTNINARSIGFIVDEVDAVITIADDFIAPPPQISNETSSYITGVGQVEGKIILLMDTRKIMGAEKFDIFMN